MDLLIIIIRLYSCRYCENVYIYSRLAVKYAHPRTRRQNIMINLNSYDTLGKNGLAMMQSGLNTANAASAQVLESGADPMSIAAASMDMSQAKAQMAVGAWLVKQQNELMETSLQIFGIGKNYTGLA